MNFLKLVALCTFMFFSSFLVGLIPLTFSIPTRSMRLLTTAGVGLLIGVAFIVIIPEGIHTYYSQPHSHAHSDNHMTESVGNQNMQNSIVQTPQLVLNHTSALQNLSQSLAQAIDQASTKPPIKNQSRRLLQHDHDHEHEHENEHDHENEETINAVQQSSKSNTKSRKSAGKSCAKPHDGAYIGLSLIAGFVLMLIVERLSGGHAHESSVSQSSNSSNDSISISTRDSHPERSPHITMMDGSGDSLSSHTNLSSPPGTPALSSLKLPPSAVSKQSNNQTALLGILLHSAIDGLAMGAISVSEESGLELVVFLAIVLHKGPAALGLSAFLLMQQRSVKQIQATLAIFSAAAPVVALTTYLLFWYASIGSQATTAPTASTLGMCLIFSAGTFLFTIAAHILPEIGKGGKPQDIKYLICLIGGCLSPLLFSSAHHH